MKYRTFLALAAIASLASISQAQNLRFVQMDREVVEARLRDAPAKNKDRKDRLEQMFREAGCGEGRLTNQKVSGSQLPNIICTLPGSSGFEIVVGAHFDNEGTGGGVVDNWSGASLLPSLYQSLSTEPRQHTFRFIGFTDEEKGLIGSAHYARKLSKDDISKITAMINLDTLGLGPAALWLNRADKDLAGKFYSVAGAMQLPKNAVNVEQVGSTDSESFRQRKIPVVTVHSLSQETLPILHSRADQHSAIKLDDYYQTYRLVTAFLTMLDR